MAGRETRTRCDARYSRLGGGLLVLAILTTAAGCFDGSHTPSNEHLFVDFPETLTFCGQPGETHKLVASIPVTPPTDRALQLLVRVTPHTPSGPLLLDTTSPRKRMTGRREGEWEVQLLESKSKRSFQLDVYAESCDFGEATFVVAQQVVARGLMGLSYDPEWGDPSVIKVVNTCYTEPSDSPPAAGRVVFAGVDRDGESDFEIYAIDSDAPAGTVAKKLTDNAWQDRDPTLSPDGTRIAFLSDRQQPGGGWYDLYLMDADGSNVERKLNFGSDGITVADPAWSPDGTKIAVVISGMGLSVLQVYDVGLDYSWDMVKGADDSSPTWSPDGTRIAFCRDGDLYVFDFLLPDPLAAPDLRLLLDDPAVDSAPAWSPEDAGGASRIVFVRNSRDLYMIEDAPGAVAEPLLAGPDADFAPDWSPDGQGLAFIRQPTTGLSGDPCVHLLELADPDGAKRAEDQVGVNSEPDWGPGSP